MTILQYQKIYLLLIIPYLMFNQGIAQLRIGNVQFEGNNRFSDEILSEWCELAPGMNWNSTLVKGANKKLLQRLHGEGYLFARVDSVALSDIGNNKIVRLRYYIHEGKPFYLGKITIESDSLAPFDIQNRMESKKGDIYREDQIELDLSYINRFCALHGFPFANIKIEQSNIRQSQSYYEIDLNLKVKEGQRIYIDTIILQGNTVTEDEVILRELDISVGEIYNQELIDNIPEKLNRLGYFKYIKPPKLIALNSTNTALLIEIEEGNTTTFDGVLGYVPQDKDITTQDGYFTGSIQLNLRNLFGTGRRFEVDWRKPDRFSDEFKIYYEEPWVLNYPINIGLGLERIVRDTTYIDRLYYLNSKLRITGSWGGTFRLIQKSSTPDSAASRDLRLANNTVLSGELGIEYDSRDYPLNPREGVLYFTSFSYGLKQITGPLYLIEQDSLIKREELQKIQLGLSYYLNLWKNQVVAVKILGGSINGSKGQLQLTDHIWFGGTRTLRGYRENQFHGTSVLWANLEYRFLIGRDSRIFIFNDWGFYNYEDSLGRQQDILPGYGLGIRFNTPLGIMGIDFGFGRGDTFSKGKIHFGLVNTF